MLIVINTYSKFNRINYTFLVLFTCWKMIKMCCMWVYLWKTCSSWCEGNLFDYIAPARKEQMHIYTLANMLYISINIPVFNMIWCMWNVECSKIIHNIIWLISIVIYEAIYHLLNRNKNTTCFEFDDRVMTFKKRHVSNGD